MSVTAVRVGVHTHNFESTLCDRTCIRCGVKMKIAERQARRERQSGIDTFDYRCEDCKPVRFFG